MSKNVRKVKITRAREGMWYRDRLGAEFEYIESWRSGFIVKNEDGKKHIERKDAELVYRNE